MNIITRLQNLLANIAGYEVNLDALKPPGGYNTDEKLLIDIADRFKSVESVGGDVVIVNLTAGTPIHAADCVFDKTFEEMKEYYVAGKTILANIFNCGLAVVRHIDEGAETFYDSDEYLERFITEIQYVTSGDGERFFIASGWVILNSDGTYNNWLYSVECDLSTIRSDY